MKKFLQLFLLCIATVITANAQRTGVIKGNVTTSDNKPAPFVTIQLNDDKPLLTDEQGSFSINNVKPGGYTLTATLVNHEPVKQTIDVAAGKTTKASLILQLTNQQLEEVTVVSPLKTFAQKETEYVARMPLKNLENPQVYSVITGKVLKEQVAVDVKDAIRNSPGALPVFFPSGGIGVISRGFITYINARNGLQFTTIRSSVDLSNIERIELLKGPSGTLFGSQISSYGGAVNIVTKRPQSFFNGEISTTLGSNQFLRTTLDINTPLNQEKTALFRMNAAWHEENSFKNYGFNHSLNLAPSFQYKVNDKLTFNADLEIFKVKQTRSTYTFLEPASGFKSIADVPLPFDETFYHDNANAHVTAVRSFLEARYQISNNWTSTTSVAFVKEDVDHSYQYYNTWVSPSLVERWVGVWGPINIQYANLQQNFNGQFKTAGIGHNLLLGLNYTNHFLDGTSSGATIDTIDITAAYQPVTKRTIDKAIGDNGFILPWGYQRKNIYSAYASDVLSLSNKIYLMLSLRFDRYDEGGTYIWGSDYHHSSFSPKLGIVYQLVKDKVSFFANYMNGFQYEAPVEQPDGRILNVKPVYANQSEAGVKIDLLNNRINASLSYFNIDISNATRTDASGFTHQDSRQVSKGLETEVIVNPVKGLNALFSYLYNSNKYGNNSPVKGNNASAAPKNVFNTWVSYRFHNTVLKGWGAGIGASYTDKLYRDSENSFGIPSYALLNATIFYENPKWRLSLKANNLANKKTWDLWGETQKLRQVLGTASFRF